MTDPLRQRLVPVLSVLGIGALSLVTLSASQPRPAGPAAAVVDIGGTVDAPLRPGATRHLDLTLTNPSAQDVTITSVSVAIVSVTSPRGPGGVPCRVSDYVVGPGHLGPLRVGAGQALALSESGTPRSDWPFVHMVDSPLDQDDCQGAVLTFDYHAGGEVR